VRAGLHHGRVPASGAVRPSDDALHIAVAGDETALRQTLRTLAMILAIGVPGAGAQVAVDQLDLAAGRRGGVARLADSAGAEEPPQRPKSN
jgi:hypothetical protein